MTTHLVHTDPFRLPLVARLGRRPGLARKIVGGLYLSTGGVHLGIVAADPNFYRPFADGALFPFVRTGWQEIFMAHPSGWGLVMTAGETALGLMLLRGGRWARVGWIGVIAFHLALLLFGWGFWMWSLPALALLVPAAIADWPSLS
jgi:hypothetical protein